MCDIFKTIYNIFFRKKAIQPQMTVYKPRFIPQLHKEIERKKCS